MGSFSLLYVYLRSSAHDVGTKVIVKILFILRTLFIFHRKTRTCFLKNMSNFSKKTYMFSEKHARLFGALIIK